MFDIEPGRNTGRDLKEAIQNEENPRKALISVGFGARFCTEMYMSTFFFFFPWDIYESAFHNFTE